MVDYLEHHWITRGRGKTQQMSADDLFPHIYSHVSNDCTLGVNVWIAQVNQLMIGIFLAEADHSFSTE